MEIVPNLWLGGEDATEGSRLDKANIRHVVQCTTALLGGDPNKDRRYLRIPIQDADVNIRAHFEEAIAFIEEGLQKNEKVLVHCMMGVSRSPTIVIAYLMHKNRWPMHRALAFVAAVREYVQPNTSFQIQLMQYQKELGIADDPEYSSFTPGHSALPTLE